MRNERTFKSKSINALIVGSQKNAQPRMWRFIYRGILFGYISRLYAAEKHLASGVERRTRALALGHVKRLSCQPAVHQLYGLGISPCSCPGRTRQVKLVVLLGGEAKTNEAFRTGTRWSEARRMLILSKPGCVVCIHNNKLLLPAIVGVAAMATRYPLPASLSTAARPPWPDLRCRICGLMFVHHGTV